MTSNFILGPGEEFVQCPYNTAHQITNARLLTHLEKCRRSYLKGLSSAEQKKVMRICRYNALHHCPALEIKFHEDRCRDAFSVVSYMAYHNSEEGRRHHEDRPKHEPSYSSDSKYSSSLKGSGSHTKVETKPDTGNTWEVEEEDWETGAGGYEPGYDPQEKLKSEVVIYNPSGLSKSERKKFRLEVREKAAEMSLTGDCGELPIASNFDVKPDLTDLKLQDEMKRRESEDKLYDHYDKEDAQYSSSYSSRSDQYSATSSKASTSYHREYRDKHKSSRGEASRDWFRQSESEFSEDDFEGYDPFM